VSPADHVRVLCAAQRFVDASVSKTVNVSGAVGGKALPGQVTFNEFKDVYRAAYDGGAKGCATYNRNGKRRGIIADRRPAPEAGRAEAATGLTLEVRRLAPDGMGAEGGACHLDAEGRRTCEG
jgi:ribonucleoside-diphosphate reductase alpha chain